MECSQEWAVPDLDWAWEILKDCGDCRISTQLTDMGMGFEIVHIHTAAYNSGPADPLS